MQKSETETFVSTQGLYGSVKLASVLNPLKTVSYILDFSYYNGGEVTQGMALYLNKWYKISTSEPQNQAGEKRSTGAKPDTGEAVQ